MQKTSPTKFKFLTLDSVLNSKKHLKEWRKRMNSIVKIFMSVRVEKKEKPPLSDGWKKARNPTF